MSSHPFVRTPEERFSDLPDYPWEPSWFEWEGLRLAYLDEGEGRPVMLFHGEPTWSFLWRKVMLPVLAAGYRVIVPDYLGFGRSDKPTEVGFYTYDRHVASMRSLVARLDLSGATAVVQDWGGPVGLRTAVEERARFDRLSILNTALFKGERGPSRGFRTWRAFVEANEDLPIGFIMRQAAVQEWPEEVLGAYEAPFPDVKHKVGARQFPLIVPMAADDPGVTEMSATMDALKEWADPVQVLFSDEDPIFSLRTGEAWVEKVPGASALEVVTHAGHFLQEDAGEEVGRRLVSFLQRTE